MKETEKQRLDLFELKRELQSRDNITIVDSLNDENYSTVYVVDSNRYRIKSAELDKDQLVAEDFEYVRRYQNVGDRFDLDHDQIKITDIHYDTVSKITEYVKKSEFMNQGGQI